MTQPRAGIERVPLGSLKRYLAATGWQRRSLPKHIESFVLTKDNDIEIILPDNRNVKDLFSRLTDAVTTLIALERRGFDEIVNSIRAISFDIVRSRLPGSAIRQDTIKLGTAEEFIKRMSRMLADVAHGELHVGPYFQRISSTALDYAQQCRFGHTFRGSFGFAIESPIGPNTLETAELLPAPPLERRAILRLARGLRLVEESIALGDPASIVAGYKVGLNANACEELAALLAAPQIGGSISFDLIFSPELRVPDDIDETTHAEIVYSPAIEIIKEAAKDLRVANYDKQRTIHGKIRTLHSMEEHPAEFFTVAGLQDVMLEWNSAEFGQRLVRVSLGPEEYLQAMEAHREGLSVSVFGEVEHRPFRLENARDFRIES